jgi:predicted unusual protein kinase regulating ubiquinone biosynthesis (AarF/ABC1/UbiB family)
LVNRNSRQCKDRWEKYLSPNIDFSKWKKEDDERLIQKVQGLGFHWVKMSQYFPNRTDASIKNRWNFLQRMKQIEIEKDNSKFQNQLLEFNFGGHFFDDFSLELPLDGNNLE